MDDEPPDNIGDHTDAAPRRDSASRTRRWLPILGIVIAVALVALIVVLHVTGTIGPGAH